MIGEKKKKKTQTAFFRPLQASTAIAGSHACLDALLYCEGFARDVSIEICEEVFTAIPTRDGE